MISIARLKDAKFRILRIIGRTILRMSKDKRPASPPYITGDGIRKSADHIYDKLNLDFDPSKVKERDVVFVGDQLVDKFLLDQHKRIEHPYVLVTSNGDSFITEELMKLAEGKVLKWYGTNCVIKHPKAVPLPLGMENMYIYVFGIPWVFKGVIKKNYPKKTRIFYGFTATTNAPERKPALEAMQRHPLAETVTRWTGYQQYLHLLAQYKFVASPPGSSIEGHRTYDAFAIGIVPIVKASITNDYFKRLGMPMWVIDDWNELLAYDEAALDRKFDEIRGNFDPRPLTLDYWTSKIRNIED